MLSFVARAKGTRDVRRALRGQRPGCRAAGLCLHIGLHKTGSSYLQRVLDEQREELLGSWGIAFPAILDQDGPLTESTPGHDALAGLIRSRPRHVHGVAALLDEIDRHGPAKALLSAENLSFARRTWQVRRLRAVTDQFASVKVLVLLRRWDTWIESLYKEHVVGGWAREHRSFEAFRRDHLRTSLQFDRRLGLWEACFGRQNLVVGNYGQLRREGRLLRFFERSLEAPGCLQAGTARHGQVRPSPSRQLTEAMRRFNEAHRDDPDYEALWRRKLESLGDDEHGERDLFERGARSAFLAGFEHQNSRLLQRYGIDLLADG